jgi:hypothetical protein
VPSSFWPCEGLLLLVNCLSIAGSCSYSKRKFSEINNEERNPSGHVASREGSQLTLVCLGLSQF